MPGFVTRREIVTTAARVGLGLAAGSLMGCAPRGSHRAEALRTEALRTVDEIDPAAIRRFADGLEGSVIVPSDPRYDGARRVWNWAIDKRPGLIVRCAGSADVARAIRFARERDLLTAIRAGGHSLAGKSTCDGGMVIDLSRMNTMRIDPATRSVRADAGVTLGEFDKATQALGLATTLGTEPTTGIAGLTLGGGLGWLMGKYGLACDNLRAVDVVTADGRTLRASATTNEDLYWAVRGAGANFGVVTSLEYQLHPVDYVLAGFVKYPPACLQEVLQLYREFTSTLPDEISVEFGMIPGMDGPPTPSIAVCYCGALEGGERALAPLRSVGPPLEDAVRAMPYLRLQELGGGMPGRMGTFVRSGFLSQLSDAAIAVMAENAVTAPPLGGSFVLEHLHGAACRVGPGDTAFPHRHPGYSFAVHAFWWESTQAGRAEKWGRGFWESMRPFMRDAVYSNYLGDEGPERARAAYGANHERLAELKSRYDRTNFFRLNQNIVPAARR